MHPDTILSPSGAIIEPATVPPVRHTTAPEHSTCLHESFTHIGLVGAQSPLGRMTQIHGAMCNGCGHTFWLNVTPTLEAAAAF